MIESIRIFVQLTPNIGSAGQLTADQFQAIFEAGYQQVINLAMPDHPDSIDNEGQLVTSLNMSYYHIPVPFAAPRAHHVREFCALMEALEGSRVFVHCVILETAVGSRKYAQALDAPGKSEKPLITDKVTTSFSYSPCTSIPCTSFSRPTSVPRMMNYQVSVFMFHCLHKVQGCSVEPSKSSMFEKWEVEAQWRGFLIYLLMKLNCRLDVG